MLLIILAATDCETWVIQSDTILRYQIIYINIITHMILIQSIRLLCNQTYKTLTEKSLDQTQV